MSPIVLILWPASVLFTAVLSFRIGYWWKTTETQGRHAAGNVLSQDPGYRNEEADQPALSSGRVATRWWHDDNTEEIPLLDDFDRGSRISDDDY